LQCLYAGEKSQLELRECDGLTDWQLNCPNGCRTADDALRLFITDPAMSRIAVWGDHDRVWTGEGREGLKILVRQKMPQMETVIRGIVTGRQGSNLLPVKYWAVGKLSENLFLAKYFWSVSG